MDGLPGFEAADEGVVQQRRERVNSLSGVGSQDVWISDALKSGFSQRLQVGTTPHS